ncbi:MAG TPA: FAD-dependent oxidoreductase, partial [Kaistiaceae bacterium]|nr:FAD-dependent oxidoreductase [Kaistiaceae bacterium]
MLHVLGAGVVGIITAHFLAEDGHEVAILDERSGAAEGCSFGNAGLLAVGHAAPWAGPGAPVQMVRALLGLDPALKIGGLPSLSLMRWGAEFLGACNASSHRDNAGRLARLTRYSRDLTREIGERLAIDYAAQHEGTFYIFKDRRAFEVHRRLFAETGSDGGDYQPISRDEIVAREPALGRLAGEIAGG